MDKENAGNLIMGSGEVPLEEYLKIRFTKITFMIRFTEDTELVREKASALRGGMGEMLLNANCVINGRRCESCGFASECLIQRMLYSRLENRPAFMQKGDSVGYMIYCDNKERFFKAGYTMEFTLTLFGANIIYFSQYLNAFYALGQHGLGANKSKFQIIGLKNLFGQKIMDGSNIYMERYKWQTLNDYVNFRLSKIKPFAEKCQYKLKFCSLTQIKYHGQFIEEFTEEALRASVLRRLFILACFENVPVQKEYQPSTDFPKIQEQQSEYGSFYRRSNRKNQAMKLHGLAGNVRIEAPSEEWLKLLLAAEITNIGKSTSFGLGKIQVLS